MYKIALVCDWYLPRIGGIEHQLRDLQRQLAARGHDAQIITATPGPAEERGDPRCTGFRSRGCRAGTPCGTGGRYASCSACLSESGSTWYTGIAYTRRWPWRQRVWPAPSGSRACSRTTPCSDAPCRHFCSHWWRSPSDGRRRTSYRRLPGSRRRPLQAARPRGRVLDPECGQSDRVDGRPTPAAASNDLQIVSVMRLTRRKRPLDLIRAIPRICAQLPRRLWPRFTIVGDGSEPRALSTKCDGWVSSDRVNFLGFRPREDLRAILSQSSIFVLPTVQEASAWPCSKPVASGCRSSR